MACDWSLFMFIWHFVIGQLLVRIRCATILNFIQTVRSHEASDRILYFCNFHSSWLKSSSRYGKWLPKQREIEENENATTMNVL